MAADRVEGRSERASFRLKLEGLQSNTTDDRFRKVDPGFSWEPGAPAPPVTSSLVDPDKKRDVEKYFAEARYERSISRKSRLRRGIMSWHAGASWDRNVDAGVLGRTVVFAGLGNSWWNRKDLKFRKVLARLRLRRLSAHLNLDARNRLVAERALSNSNARRSR